MGASLLVVLDVEVHEQNEENGRVQQQQGRDELGEGAVLGQHRPDRVENAQHELGLQVRGGEKRDEEMCKSMSKHASNKKTATKKC